MGRRWSAGLLLLTAAAGAVEAGTPPQAERYRVLLDQYCVGCHNRRSRTANLALDMADLDHVPESAATWEKVIRKLRANAMPPPQMPQPEKTNRQAFVHWLETSLDRAAAVAPNPGTTPAHRLNRTEYADAVRDLLAIDIDAEALLPPDDTGFGFDNIADVLSVSPMLTERYLNAARKISRDAVGDPTLRPLTESFAVSKYLKQDDRAGEDLPFGSRGGIAVRHWFPVDGEYVVKIFLLRTYDGFVRGVAEPHTLELRVNGERIRRFTVGGAGTDVAGRPRKEVPDPEAEGQEVRFVAKAGAGTISVSFLKETAVAEGMERPVYAVNSYEYAGDVTVLPGVGSIELRGPYRVSGPGESASRRRIFVCSEHSDACARKILSALARRAYRRPVAEADLAPLVDFFERTRARAGFDAGIEAALERVLVSPDFLFRIERDTGSVPHRLSDVELASRLSFFLWSSIPDDQLLAAAQRGYLHQSAVLEKQVKRMLADPKTMRMLENFTGQWLLCAQRAPVSPDPRRSPYFDANLREALRARARIVSGRSVSRGPLRCSIC